MPLKISAVLICLNEEHAISRCLNSLSWADEIVVIDGGSTDLTPRIANDRCAPWASKLKWILNPWPGFRAQRNLALSSATNDWIFVIDADEACSPELIARMKAFQAMAAEPMTKYYKVRRQEYFLGKAIHYGIWNPSYQDRFFHKRGIEYKNEIHEYPPYPSIPDRIHEPLLHWPDFGPDQFLYKLNKYTTIEAKNRYDSGQRTYLLRILSAGPAMFFKNYFYYKSYRDGAHGLVISILEGISRAVRHIKIWRLQNEAKNLGLHARSKRD